MNERTENVYENKGALWKTPEPKVGVASPSARASTYHPKPSSIEEGTILLRAES
jgi:hypothetical protein